MNGWKCQDSGRETLCGLLPPVFISHNHIKSKLLQALRLVLRLGSAKKVRGNLSSH